MKSVVILQSNYIPWRGYFDLLRQADDFVFYDTVQYTKNDWRNRNRILGQNGPIWLTIPTATSNKFGQTIAETKISDQRWAKRHLGTLQAAMGKAEHFRDTLAPALSEWYTEAGKMEFLSDVNRFFIERIMELLSLNTRLHSVPELPDIEDPTARLVAICKHLRATRYLSGPAAQSYLDTAQFEAEGIAVDWMTYPEYPSYKQHGAEFVSHMSILEALAALPKEKIFE